MWVGVDAGSWGAATDISGAVNYVRLDQPTAALAQSYASANVKVICNISGDISNGYPGSYNTGGIAAINATNWATHAVSWYTSLSAANRANTVAIEVCNEPAGTWFWGLGAHTGMGANTQANAIAYANLLKTVHNAFVVAFGVGNFPKLLASYDGGYENSTQWGQWWWAVSGGTYIDGITLHPYGRTSTSLTLSAQGNQANVAAAHSQTGLPIYITETGWSTSALPAPFPSRLRTSGQQLVDENGYAMPILRGFSVQTWSGSAWPQSAFNDMASIGARIERVVIFWDTLEPTQGVINTTYVTTGIDPHIARAQAAGIYSELELHLNVGRDPSWTTGVPYETDRFSTYGQTVTQYLANRYGNPASPQYTKSVLGFGLNEPPVDSTRLNGSNSIPYLEGIQSQMIGWMRATGFAPAWIGFVCVPYGAATPIYDPTFQNSAAVNASPTAYNAVGGNVIMDCHDYMEGITGSTSTSPTAQARQWNGMIYPDYQGGPLVGVDSTSDPTYTSTSVTRSQLANYVAPYKVFSSFAQIPFMIGEWGTVSTMGGQLAWIADQGAIWTDAGAVIQMYWDYDTGGSFSARPGGTWLPVVLAWMAQWPTYPFHWTESDQATNVTNFGAWALGTGYVAAFIYHNYRDL